jgi:hypothetical protein
VLHTDGDPPNHGSRKRAAIGSIRKRRKAPIAIVN